MILTEDTFDIKISGDMIKFYFKPAFEKRMYQLLRTHLWSLFNKLIMDKTFNPKIKLGVAKPTVYKPSFDEARIDKKTYKINKPDIEHIETDNLNPDDLTSDSSDDEAVKEEKFNMIHNIKNDEMLGIKSSTHQIKTKFDIEGYGDVD